MLPGVLARQVSAAFASRAAEGQRLAHLTFRATDCAAEPVSLLPRVNSPTYRRDPSEAIAMANQILLQLLNGLVVGSSLALVAAGLALLFGVLHIINFAQGDFFMLRGYAVWFILTA